MKLKKILSIAIIITMVVSTMGISTNAEVTNEAETQEIVHVNNPQFMTFDEEKNQMPSGALRSSNNANSNSINVSLVDNYAILDWYKTGTMKIKLYNSSYSFTEGDTFLGILEEAENPNFDIANFRIETKASSLALTDENLSYANQPVLYLGIWDKENEKIYYIQEKITESLPEDLKETVSNLSTDLTNEDLEQIEISYLALNVHGIPDFIVDSSSFENNDTTLTTNLGTAVKGSTQGSRSLLAANVVPGVPNSTYAITMLNQWQNVFDGWASEFGYALYAQLYAGTKNRIIYTLPYLLSKNKTLSTAPQQHGVTFKLYHNSLVSYDASYGTLTAKEGTAAKCETTMWARCSNEKGVITSRKQSAVISESRLLKALKVIIYSIEAANIGTAIETLTTYNNSDPTDDWNVWASNYVNQVRAGSIKKAYRFVQNNLKTAEDRTWLGIKTDNATSFDIGCTLRFYF